MLPQTFSLALFRLVRVTAAVIGALALVVLLLSAFAPAQVALGEPQAVGLQVDKLGPDTVFAGETMTYTILVTNTTGQTLNGVVITDTWNSQDYSGAYSYGGGVIVDSFTFVTQPTKYAQFNLLPMGPGAGFIQISMTILPSLQPRYDRNPIIIIVGNSVVITTSNPGVTAGTDRVDTKIVGPVLRLTKTYTPTNPRPGRLLTYTFILENQNRTDAIDATNVVITEKIPINTIFYAAHPPSIATYDPGTNIVQWNLTQTVPVSSFAYVMLTVRVTPTAQFGNINNPRTNCGVRADAIPQTILCHQDVSFTVDNVFEKVAETVSPPAQTGNISRTFPNRALTYTVSVYNPFTETVTGMIVTDTLPSADNPPLPTRTFQYSGLLSSAPPGSPTVISQSTKIVAWQLPAIQGWGVYTFAFQAFVPPQMPIDNNQIEKEYTNQLAGSHAGIVLPSNLGNDNSMKVKVVEQVRISKVVTPTQQLYSLPVTYTITLSNSGPTTIRNIQITDTLPTSPFCAFQWDGFVSGLAPTSAGGNTVVWNQGITLTEYAMTTVATFRATVYGTPNTDCYNTVEGFSLDTYIVKRTLLAPVKVLPPFGFNKTVNRSSVILSETIEYTVREFNLSTIQATMNGFTDVLPSGFLYNGGSIYADFTNMPLTLLPNQQNEYATTFTVLVRSTPEPCDNLPRTIFQKKGTFGIEIIDPPQLVGFWTNAVDAAPVVVHPHARVTKVADPPAVLPGQVVTFTIVLSNNTGVQINNVRVTDTLPNGFTFNSMVQGDSPISAGPPNVIWDNQTVPANGTHTLIFRVNASTITGNYQNNVKAASTTDPLICIPKLTPALTIPVKRGLVEVNKTASPNSVGPLGQFVYDISLKNIGPYTVTVSRFTDTLPGVPGHIWTFVSMQGGDPSPASTNPPAWANLTIGPDQTQRLRFTVRTNTQVGTYPNLFNPAPLAGYMTATLPASWELTRPQSYNGAPVTVIPGVGLLKEVYPEAQLAGQTVVYTITLVNVSGQTINNVRVTDTLPSGFTFDSMVSGGGPLTTSPLVWSLGNVSSGEQNKKVLVFRVRIVGNQPSGTYYNRVTASADNISIAPTDDIAPVAVTELPFHNYLPLVMKNR